MANHKSKFSQAVGASKSLIWRAWKSRAQREEFEELQEKLLAGSRDSNERITAFWAAYIHFSKEYGPVESVEVPEEYQEKPEEKPEGETLEVLIKKSESTNIVADFLWAYESPKMASPEDAPSAGAWFFFDMRKNNKNKFADLTLRILDRLAAQQDEQKSREADYTEAVGLLEGAAEKHFSSKNFGELRRTIRRGAERIREQSAVPTENT